MKMRFKGLVVVVSVLAGPAFAQDSDLLRCRKNADPVQRLACYDAIGIKAPATEATRSQVEEFGRVRAPAEEIAAISSTLVEEMDGWRENTRFRLSNGQVWQVSDGSSGFIRPGAREVVLRRGALGSFFLEIEGMKRSPRVRRIQ